MKKLIFKTLEQEIKALCESHPKSLVGIVDYHNETETSKQLESVVKLLQSETYVPGRGKISRYRAMIIYAVIHGGVFNKEVADSYFVSKSDVEETYNKYFWYRQFLLTQDEFDNFVEYLFDKAKVAYQEEIQKAKEFTKNATLFDQLFHAYPPRYWSEEKKNSAARQLKALLNEKKALDIKNVDKHLGGGAPSNDELTDDEYESLTSNLKIKIKECKAVIQQETKRLEGKRPKGERKNFTLIGLFKLADLMYENAQISYSLSLGTYSIAREVLQMYCSWFNNKYDADIKEEQKAQRKAKDKQRHSLKSEAKKRARLETLKVRQKEIYQLQLKGMSIRQIANKLGYSYGTVQSVCKRIQTLITEQ